jgi:hypothetical protein
MQFLKNIGHFLRGVEKARGWKLLVFTGGEALRARNGPILSLMDPANHPLTP